MHFYLLRKQWYAAWLAKSKQLLAGGCSTPSAPSPLITGRACWRSSSSRAPIRSFSSPCHKQAMSPAPVQHPHLVFWERTPPFAAYATAKLAACSLDVRSEVKGTKDTLHLAFSSGDKLMGLPLILRYIVRAGTCGLSGGLYASDALSATQVDFWLDYVCSSVVPGSGLEAVLLAINDYLTFRSFLVGHATTAADVALWGQLQGNPLWKKLKMSGKYPHLSRWFDYFAELPECKTAAEELVAMDSKKQKEAAAAAAQAAAAANAAPGTFVKKATADAGGSFDVGLPNAEMGKVVTRFPPEPSGFLHIGHAKAALLNQHFAEMYKGRLLVRFDDTNPSKEKDEFVDNIIKDIKDLGLTFEKITYTSDYFPQLLDMGERLIKAGVLYADDTPVEQMREERLNRVESKCRGRSVAENLAAWEEMKKGTDAGVNYALRFKFDMKSVNGCLRDPVAFRCNPTHHWRTGLKFKVYPTYDFACPFVDAYEGVTHALRTSEYKDREDQYYWVLKEMQKVWPGLPHVHMWDYSRLNFVNTVLSKRKLTWFVETGRVDGWADPRMPTVQGIFRRGLRIEALKEFILQQGASRNVTFQEWDKIWSINKRLIDPVCPRHTAVENRARVPVRLTNGPPETEVVVIPRHKKYEPAGKKALLRSSQIWLDQNDAKELQDGEEFTLMDWGNAVVKSITKDPSGVVTSMDVALHLEGDVKKTKWKLTWLAQSDELVDLCLLDFDYLVTKRKIEEEDDFMALVNPHTRFETAAQGDTNMRTLQKGDVLQLERKGYFIVDEPLTKPGKPMVLFNIPDGRTKNMTAPKQSDT
ncbi:tRNA synthetases class I, catalytic domain-containing protein [Dunaliella salina]|uniref:glutamate--tRNA ligase n=1 Tax=Dunaliella salina TaxID=3046 RepID=A0ABQ7GFA5_DUNSA|nr:tRNA synthetases class I, catalytic domain-containing protein [Dunaliella salina]|eukprot:KAF5833287.1 tRNA synthetases class I, catalytic domain-containing protein [Dunaliella salina]